MGAKFDHWLSKPSTLCLLRRLSPVQQVHSKARCSRCSTTFPSRRQDLGRYIHSSRSHEGNSHDEMGQESQGRNAQRASTTFKIRKFNGTPHAGLTARDLRMSLSAEGAPMGTNDIPFMSFAQLREQTNVDNNDKIGKLIIDEQEATQDMELWIEILRFRERLDGHLGVMDVWYGMRKRNVDLPTSGEEARILWDTFVKAAVTLSDISTFSKVNLLRKVFDYAVSLRDQSGTHVECLYQSVIGRLLRAEGQQVGTFTLRWSKRLCDAGFQSANGVVAIVTDAILSRNTYSKPLRLFRHIYLSSAYRDLYDRCIEEAFRLDDEAAALYLHRIFLSAGDGPSTEYFGTSSVQSLFELDKDKSLPMKRSGANQTRHLTAPESKALKEGLPAMTRASMNAIVGDVHNIKPKEISDHFCARIVATRALSIDLVIKALSMFGVEKIGPLALREMTLRAGTPIGMSTYLNSLRDHGIK